MLEVFNVKYHLVTGYNSGGGQYIHDSILPETTDTGSRHSLTFSHQVSQWYNIHIPYSAHY